MVHGTQGKNLVINDWGYPTGAVLLSQQIRGTSQICVNGQFMKGQKEIKSQHTGMLLFSQEMRDST